MGSEILAFGTLCLDGKPVYPGATYSGQLIQIGPSMAGLRLYWYYTEGKLIANRCFLTNISWDSLNAQGLVYGKEVVIGAMRCRLRLLRGDVGELGEGELGEWEELVNAAGGPTYVMGDGILSWGQNCEDDNENWLVAFKCTTGAWSGYYASSEEENFGWRPVLEVLSMESTALLGKTVIATDAHGNQVSGLLESVTDYDLVLGGQVNVYHPNGQNHTFCGDIGQGKVAVNRQELLLLEENQEEI